MKVILGTQPCDAGHLPALGERGREGGMKKVFLSSLEEGIIIVTLISVWDL